MQCVILAGGLGTRMRPATEQIPKTLLPVAGRPFVAWQLELLSHRGVTDVLFCTGHLGEQIERFVGDGSRWGVSAKYSAEGDSLLGTGGALRLAADRGLLDSEFLVTYGDAYLSVEPAALVAELAKTAKPVVMSVWRNRGRVVPSNAGFDGDAVTYAKAKPVRGAEWVDYGMLAIERSVVLAEIPPDVVVDLATVLEALSAQGRLGGLEVKERCYEIGSPEGLAALEELLRNTHEYRDSSDSSYTDGAKFQHPFATVRRADRETPR
ncbi:MAG: sugar phosphate nucleotidyltransferase [Acidimicrobiia bacterium]